MKTHISREDLLKGIQATYPIVPTKSTLPILSHLLLEARKNNIHLASTDLEVGISCSIPAEVFEEGAVTLPAKRLNDLVKELPNISLTISAKKNQQVSIECEQGLFKILGLPKEEFPNLPHPESQEVLVIDQGVLQAMLSLTAFATSKDESRYVLTGILFIWKKEWLRLVATDGRRLAIIERQAATEGSTEHQVIVPLKTISELHRLLGDGPTVKISFRENQIAFDLGNTARRISLWATQDSPSIRLDLKANRLILSKQTPEVGEAHEELKAQYGGPEFSIGFNPTYLIDVLKVLPDEEVTLELPGPDRPGVIRTRDHYLYIVLPMQLNP
ncbi:MAG: DNA polymerase III subunit beta [Candidatus Omnitrophica bacterium]|nr:DNA polymerase III subunit beta [Candidatus Omnitrophota bacterium]